MLKLKLLSEIFKDFMKLINNIIVNIQQKLKKFLFVILILFILYL